jgi:hypothetical protein
MASVALDQSNRPLSTIVILLRVSNIFRYIPNNQVGLGALGVAIAPEAIAPQ